MILIYILKYAANFAIHKGNRFRVQIIRSTFVIYNDNYSSGISYHMKLIIGEGLAIVFNAFESINVTVLDKCCIFKDFSFYLHLETGLKWHV